MISIRVALAKENAVKLPNRRNSPEGTDCKSLFGDESEPAVDFGFE
jgi:hypothetical protein